jgi:peptidyl-tRNA hydrolase, PTH2 family
MIKQVIVMRRDLKMRRGKEIAQGAHASMAFLSKKVRAGELFNDLEFEWLNGLFTKVCVRVDSEEALMKVADQAKAEGLQVEVITDSGKTEFGGVPTRTCLAIGPDQAEKIDKVTGSLELY